MEWLQAQMNLGTAIGLMDIGTMFFVVLAIREALDAYRGIYDEWTR